MRVMLPLEALHSNIGSMIGVWARPLGLKSNLENILPVLTPHLRGRKWKELALFYFTVGGQAEIKVRCGND